jgi:hypothetical protein
VDLEHNTNSEWNPELEATNNFILKTKRTECYESDVIKCDNTSHICFPSTALCDGITDCPNGYDESVKLCGEFTQIMLF